MGVIFDKLGGIAVICRYEKEEIEASVRVCLTTASSMIAYQATLKSQPEPNSV
jgi:hypothetical protein